MEELRDEVLTEEIEKEETTEIFEPDVDDIIPAEETDCDSSSGAGIFVAGALVTGAIIGTIALVRKIKRGKKAKEKESEELLADDDPDDVFEEEPDDPSEKPEK